MLVEGTNFVSSTFFRGFCSEFMDASPRVVVFCHVLYKIISYILRVIDKGTIFNHIKGYPCGIKETIIQGVDTEPFFNPMKQAQSH